MDITIIEAITFGISSYAAGQTLGYASGSGATPIYIKCSVMVNDFIDSFPEDMDIMDMKVKSVSVIHRPILPNICGCYYNENNICAINKKRCKYL